MPRLRKRLKKLAAAFSGSARPSHRIATGLKIFLLPKRKFYGAQLRKKVAPFSFAWKHIETGSGLSGVPDRSTPGSVSR